MVVSTKSFPSGGPSGVSEFESFLVPFSGTEEALRARIEPIMHGEQLELVLLHFVRGHFKDTLRVFVDRPGAGVTPGKGVSMAELEVASRLLSDVLDVEDNKNADLFPKPFDLEVGSPGVDRPLTKRSHYSDVVGQKLKVKTRLPKDGVRSFTGILMIIAAGADTISLDDGGKITSLPFAEIEDANVIYALPEKGQKRSLSNKTSTKKKR
jgi:ribosome maturation factor RimP